MSYRSLFASVLAVLVLFMPGASAADTDADLLRRLQTGGHVLVVRHAATVPGKGDPPNFTHGDCATQRNLSEGGRADALKLGAELRAGKVPIGSVLSSRWCRCSDTARLAFGWVEPATMLDSSGSDDEAGRQRKVDAVRAHIRAYKGPGNLVLVTHETNIRELIGEKLEQGEMVVVAPKADGTLEVVGRLAVQQSAGAGQSMH